MAKTKPISKKLREDLLKQALEEIQFDRDYKRHRIESWHKIEKKLKNVKTTLSDVRANVGVSNAKMQGFVQTLHSKIDAPPNIKYNKGSEADLKAAEHTNALFKQDMAPQHNNLAFKDQLGKKGGIKHGRVIYEYHASSDGGYKSVLSSVSAYDFLIDPSAGGEDIEKAEHLGRGGIWKNTYKLNKGVKDGLYIASEVKKLTDANAGDDPEASEEEKAKYESSIYLTGEGAKIKQTDGKWLFFEWYTTDPKTGERYYMLINEASKVCVRIEKLKTMFKSGLYPFWTYATDPDADEFWSLSPCEQVYSLFEAQGESIDQMMDNAEAVNRPMKGVVGSAVKNLASLRYGRDKVIRFKTGTDLQKSVRVFNEVPSIETPIKVYDILERIGNIESPVNAGTKGVAEEEKVGIYNGDQAPVADRIGLINKSYADGYRRFGLLYYQGIKEHLNKKVAIEMLGANGIEYKEVTKKEVIPSKDFTIIVEASDAETANDAIDKKNQMTYLQSLKGDATINQKARIEMEAEIAGLPQDKVQRLLDVSEFGDARLLSEAARDIENILAGVDVKPNENATNAYRAKIIAYMRDNKEHIEMKVWKKFEAYVKDLRPIVTKNMIAKAEDQAAKNSQLMIDQARGGMPMSPSQPRM